LLGELSKEIKTWVRGLPDRPVDGGDQKKKRRKRIQGDSLSPGGHGRLEANLKEGEKPEGSRVALANGTGRYIDLNRALREKKGQGGKLELGVWEGETGKINKDCLEGGEK